ncbi:MAG: methionine--tRNA ligase [Planctomycetes bacterium]|nr:methionine--tRNA ligase [Planctomycetota bacterium]
MTPPRPKFYITTAIDYVNSVPHVGTAYEKIGADALARWKRLTGFDTFFLMGNDEHSVNVERRAREQNLDPLAYCDRMQVEFETVWKALHLSYDRFIRTTEPAHRAAVQALYERVKAAGAVTRGKYTGWYCVSCEAYKKESDLVDGLCPNHRQKPQWIEEENWFFTLSRYQDALLRHIESHPGFVRPESRRNEILSAIRAGLDDISISRSTFKWGIPVPGDPAQVFYVWFDALPNYIAGAGFATDDARFARLWPADVHVVGKDITRFHCIIWPAMLMAAGLPLPQAVHGHGFVYLQGAKIGKTLGNVVDPLGLAREFGGDAVRYFLLREIEFDRDGDFSRDKLTDRYNADLANDLGNLVFRTTNMIHKYFGGKVRRPADPGGFVALQSKMAEGWDEQSARMDRLEFSAALAAVWSHVRAANLYIEQEAPWKLAKTGQQERLAGVLWSVTDALRMLSVHLAPFIPVTAEKIWAQIGMTTPFDRLYAGGESSEGRSPDRVPDGQPVSLGTPLFPRIEPPGEKQERPA